VTAVIRYPLMLCRKLLCVSGGHTCVNCKWDPMTVTNNTFYTAALMFLQIFWPDDGLNRPKIVANI